MIHEVVISSRTITVTELLAINNSIVEALNASDGLLALFVDIFELTGVSGLTDFMKQPQGLAGDIITHPKRGKTVILTKKENARVNIPALFMKSSNYFRGEEHSIVLVHSRQEFERLKALSQAST